MSPLRRITLVASLSVGLAGLGLLPAPPRALASRAQIAMFQDDRGMFSDPAGTIRSLRGLGVGLVRVSLRWNELAPDPGASRPPSGFAGADPASYPAQNWSRYDAIVRQAEAAGIGIDFVLAGPAPLWASAPGAPRSGGPFPEWRPSARAYGQVVAAIARRYGGRYVPPGASSPLPRVHFWEIWNEPNFGQDLAPQAVRGSSVSTAPRMYRGLLNAAWGSFAATGHGLDTIVIGGLSPRGYQARPTRRWREGLPGEFSTTKPLRFIRTLYCVDGQLRRLRGGAAAAVGCPSTATASRRFRTDNPVLFNAGGFGVHPYPYNTPPPTADSSDPDYTEFSEIPRLARTLDQLQRDYGSKRQLPIYNTEYGYITSPPQRGHNFVTSATAAYYLNWAEYLSWRNPRLVSTMQYQLADPDPTVNVPEYGGFASGLMFSTHRLKADYYAYRMPIFLPHSRTRRGHALAVWGCVRPAHFAALDTGRRIQPVAVQFRRGRRGPFQTLERIAIRDEHGYFEAPVAFPTSGEVRLAWSYPDGRTISSRVVRVSVG